MSQVIKKTQFIKNVGSGWLCTVVVGLSGFVILPLNLRYLGKNVYGISVLAASIFHLLTMFKFGMMPTFQRFFSNAIAEKNDDRFEELSSTTQLLMFIFGFLAGLIFIGCYPRFIREYNVAESLHFDVFMLFLVLAFSLWESLFLLPFIAMVQGSHHFDFINAVQMLAVVIRFVLLYIGYRFVTPTLCIMAVAFFVEALFRVILICSMSYLIHRKKVLFRWNRLKCDILPALFSFGIFSFLTFFSYSLSIQLPVLIIGKNLGVDMVAAYSPAMAIGSLLMTVFNYVSTPLIPIASQDRISNSGRNLGKLSVMMSSVVASGCGCVVVGLIFVSKDFLTVWLGKDFAWCAPVVVATAGGIVLTSVQHVNYNIAIGASVIKSFAYSAAVIMVLIVVGTYIGTKYWGWNLLSTSIYIALIRLVREVCYLMFVSSKLFHYDLGGYFWKTYLKPTILTSFVVVLGLFLKRCLEPYEPSIIRIIVHSIVIVLAYGLLAWMFLLDSDVKRRLAKQ